MRGSARQTHPLPGRQQRSALSPGPRSSQPKSLAVEREKLLCAQPLPPPQAAAGSHPYTCWVRLPRARGPRSTTGTGVPTHEEHSLSDLPPGQSPTTAPRSTRALQPARNTLGFLNTSRPCSRTRRASLPETRGTESLRAWDVPDPAPPIFPTVHAHALYPPPAGVVTALAGCRGPLSTSKPSSAQAHGLLQRRPSWRATCRRVSLGRT